MRALLLCSSCAAGAGEPRAAAERTAAGQRKGGFCPRVCGPKGGDLAAHVENGPARACRGRRSVARGQPPCESRVASWRGPPRLHSQLYSQPDKHGRREKSPVATHLTTSGKDARRRPRYACERQRPTPSPRSGRCGRRSHSDTRPAERRSDASSSRQGSVQRRTHTKGAQGASRGPERARVRRTETTDADLAFAVFQAPSGLRGPDLLCTHCSATRPKQPHERTRSLDSDAVVRSSPIHQLPTILSSSFCPAPSSPR